MHRRIFLLAAILAIASTAIAQVSAKHVEEPPKQLSGERFKSPMALEFPLAVADHSMWGVGEVRRDSLTKYICDSVSYRDFSTQAEKPRSGMVLLKFRFMLYDEPGVDKRVDVGVELVRGEATLGSGVLKNIKLGEKKTVQRTIEVTSAENALATGPAPTVRLTTVVRDDP